MEQRKKERAVIKTNKRGEFKMTKIKRTLWGPELSSYVICFCLKFSNIA